MIKNFLYPVLIACFLLTGCAVNKKAYDPAKKYAPPELKADFTLLRNILEKNHPALYWYTPKDSMDYFFDSLSNKITDSMTELQFGWKIVAPLTQKIHCGHTSFSMSKDWNNYVKNRQIPIFPLFLKVWPDTMVIMGNMNHKDSILKRGIRTHDLVGEMFKYLPEDGYDENVNYIRLSSNFPYYHRNVFGIFKNYRVGYIDSAGEEKTKLVSMFVAPVDSSKKTKTKQPETLSKKQIRNEKIQSIRSFAIDSSIHTAVITLNTFSGGEGKNLRHFIKHSFKRIHQEKINNLIIDLRSNGGGDIGKSALLTKYLRNTKFKISDTAYSIRKTLHPYTKYIHQGLLTNIGMFLLSRKHKDGRYHYGFLERHWFHPKRIHHFNGKVYVLINGSTFSASTLFCNAIKGQPNIQLVGENAGGGWYGNSGVMIPDITLPITKIKVRLPLFKMIQFNHQPVKGIGVTPDWYIPPTVDGIKQGIDRKMLLVKEHIKAEQQK